MAEPYLTAQQKASRAINKGAEASQSPCYVCKKMLWMSFFFDAPKFDATEDRASPERLTNVGKLLAIHRESNPDRGVYVIYLNGLQKPLNSQNYARSQTAKEISKTTFEEGARDKIKDAGKEAAKKAAETRKPEISAFTDLLNPKSWKDVIFKAIFEAAKEGVGFIRDNPVFSSFTESGVTTRINNAVTEFENILKRQTQEITRIRIAIFGADMGAAIARAFANKLINEHMKIDGDKVLCDKAEVEFMFMGLFDCVSSRSKDVINSAALSKASLGQYSQGLDAPMGIRPQFRYVYHAVAAHENRPYKRIDSIRKCNAPVISEELFAGEQRDVVGGHLPGEEGRSNQLSRISLMRMYSSAMVQAVPLRSLEQIETVDAKLTAAFTLTDKLVENGIPRDTSARILAIMRPDLNTVGLEEGLVAGARQRLRWLATAYSDLNRRQRYQEQFDRLRKQFERIDQAFNHPMAQSEAQVRLGLDIYATELKLRGDWQTYYTRFNGEYPQRMSAEDAGIEALFEQFIHDAFAGMKDDGVDQMESALTLGDGRWGYLTPRPVDSSDTFE